MVIKYLEKLKISHCKALRYSRRLHASRVVYRTALLLYVERVRCDCSLLSVRGTLRGKVRLHYAYRPWTVLKRPVLGAGPCPKTSCI